ncbi:hypothetical protein VOLCADRAFT_104481 [Volvox carteri f. nagariensis]|uniref:BZIP domain-containing protein n=1 Tax=Volvox carteri f. nagariensis TaxID=3068 RepID=D8TTW2_VOLCA|nr:uncharacterized protein VOLCADRAFT_104481 [Volvox carteri f. nagariensis]EFJ48934.1 hypothetical protein VOLCADRAFT_104481 [Volvox carteri f. nagariensis]|eukprot:XP_002949831.1 hypothetical protein VOLCADRAFT_104481 [Volvox carteri f. nagariensis]
MEDLGLGDPLGSLGADLAGYLEGAGFVGAGLEQPFLGELEAIASRLEMPHSFTEQQDVKAGELPTTSAADILSQDDDEEAGRAGQSGPKRRRRTRTERQQVLNRLAQQRYRQRKKEKVQALQSTVGTLQSQLDRLSFLEAENADLRATTQQLGEQIGVKDAALLQMQQQLRQTCVALKVQQEKCAAQERQLTEAQQTMEAQRQQLRSSSLAGLDPQALSDRLLAIIKEALADAQSAGGSGGGCSGSSSSQGGSGGQGQLAQPLSLMSDAVVQRISRTLTSCCRELVYATKGKQAAAAADTPSAIPVSCC